MYPQFILEFIIFRLKTQVKNGPRNLSELLPVGQSSQCKNPQSEKSFLVKEERDQHFQYDEHNLLSGAVFRQLRKLTHRAEKEF